VVWQQCPGKAGCGGFRQYGGKTSDVVVSAGIVQGNVSLLNSPSDDVVKRAWCVYSRFSRHTYLRIKLRNRVKRINAWAPLLW